ncbi:MAG: hypothetical protein M1114_01620 [Candidatus Dependentiae bacterium]|nr:hypothetical protein [Candidatus Dependentiae bacterium]
MKKLLHIMLITIYGNSLLASWYQPTLQGLQEKYSAYFSPALQSTYDYIRSINPKYLIAGTLVGLATLAYLKNKFSLLAPQQILIQKMLEQDITTYFVPKKYNELQPGTIWDNQLIKNALLLQHEDPAVDATVIDGNKYYFVSIIKTKSGGLKISLTIQISPIQTVAEWGGESDNNWTITETNI